MTFDPFNKEPGVYLTESPSPPPPPSGVPATTAAMFGVSEWGPIGEAMLVNTFPEWTRLFGSYISKIYPSYRQVKKYFKNGGNRLYFSRIAHYTDPTDPDSCIAVNSTGYIYDDAKTPSSIAASVANVSNTGDEGEGTSSGTYVGTVDGQFRVIVTTAGAYGGTGEVTIYFTPDGGSESMVGTELPADGVAFDLENGVQFQLDDGGDLVLTIDDEWTIDVTSEAYGSADQRIKAIAKYPGLKGNDITLDISAGTNGVSGEFALVVNYEGVLAEPIWDNLSLNESDGNYFIKVINNENNGSKFIALEDLKATNTNPVGLTQDTIVLSGGDDGLTGLVDADYIGDSTAQTGIQTFSTVEEPLLIGCPDSCLKTTALIRKEICRYVNNDHKTSYGVLVIPENYTPEAALTFQTTTLSTDSERTSIYYLHGIDEETGEKLSPLGAIMGVYARFSSDPNKGVWWSPAGYEATLLGFSGLERKVSSLNAGILNENRINVLKVVPNVGVIINGSRTMAIARSADYKYIGARLNTSNLEALILKNTRWASQRPHDNRLYRDITATASAILRKRYLAGGLDGNSTSEAYSVICNTSVNTQVEKNAGIVVCRIGILNKQTAEFIWFNINQMSSGGFVIE